MTFKTTTNGMAIMAIRFVARRTRHHHHYQQQRRAHVQRQRHNHQSFSTTTSSTMLFQSDPLLVNSKKAPSDFVPSCAVVYKDVITEEEAMILSTAVLSRMKRRRYEKGHWDAVITGYKEIELFDDYFIENEKSSNILTMFERIREQLKQLHLIDAYGGDKSIDECKASWLNCHAIDLKKDGKLMAHVDSIRFSGHLVAGISLLSSSIMRLIPDNNQDENDDHQEEKKKSEEERLQNGYVDLYLPPRSMYALTGVGRYNYTHELLPSGSTFNSPDGTDSIIVDRDHRLSIIFRDAKQD